MTGSSDSPVTELAAADVAAEAYILDVREDAEWQAGHIDHSVHIPLGELMSRVDEVPAGQQVVVACRSGARSERAAAYLCQLGRDAVNLDGGLIAWTRAGRALVAADGSPGRVG